MKLLILIATTLSYHLLIPILPALLNHSLLSTPSIIVIALGIAYTIATYIINIHYPWISTIRTKIGFKGQTRADKYIVLLMIAHRVAQYLLLTVRFNANNCKCCPVVGVGAIMAAVGLSMRLWSLMHNKFLMPTVQIQEGHKVV